MMEKTPYTKATSYKDRLKAWQDFLQAMKEQIELAKAFQEAGKLIILKF